MQAIVKFSPNVELHIDGNDEMVVMNKALVLGSPRRKCNVCDVVDSKRMVTNKDNDGNIYINYRCKCGAYSKLGQYKDKSGYFWREYEVYEKSSK